MPFPIGGPLEPSLSLIVSEIFNVECNAIIDMTFIQPVNKGRHSFWYKSISHMISYRARQKSKPLGKIRISGIVVNF